jgi:predicted dehydrogenase
MSEKLLQIGMVGAGFISHYHIQGVQEAGGVIHSVYNHTLEKAKTRASEYDITQATDQYDDLLHDPDIDALIIATPDFTHQDYTIRALQAGKPVLLQKPMGRNADECLAMIDAAEETGTPLYVSFMHRYFEEIEALQQLLKQDALGQVFSIRQRNATPGADWAAWFYSKDQVGGGVMLQLGVHGIDLLRYVFGEITHVKATTERMVKARQLADGTIVTPDNEDFVIATYRFASGAIAVHECSYTEVAGTDRFRMEVYGSAGTAWLRTERGRLAIYAPDHIGQSGWLASDLNAERVGYRQHRHFIDMVRGTAPPDNSAHDGLMSIRVAEAIYRAAASTTWEAVVTS